MLRQLGNLFRVESLRSKIFVTLGLLFVYRFGNQLLLPGVDYSSMQDWLGKQADSGVTPFVGLMNALAGANVNMPVFMSLGILPYITSSIIFSLLVKVVPSLEALSKEGASGQRKINQYSRLFTVPICVFQAIAICLTFFRGLAVPAGEGGAGAIHSFDFGFIAMAVLGMTAGTIFLMWIGEQITAHGIGNGVSLIITANIVSDIPTAFFRILDQAQKDRTFILIAVLMAMVYLGVVIGVVYMTKAQRRVPIHQAKQMKGNRQVGGGRHYLPFKLNQANVMPVIFASAVLTLPTTIATAVSGGSFDFIAYGGWWWITVELTLIVFFAYFWTSLMFQPAEMANNLKEYGVFIPGQRPGKQTAEFLNKIMIHVTLVGAAFLAALAVLPTIASEAMGIDRFVAQFLGGTGILIVVGVTLDLVDQLNAGLLNRQYDGFMSAASSRRGARG
ncbi:MAG: preprotein translocase subunit SecY [Planctomycetes bacterium]|nr:preprotein translocase subunit SecY [Planctomycetota bacterium]